MAEPGARVDPRTLLAAVPAACALLDADLVVRDVSAAFLTLTGRSRTQVVGLGLLHSLPGNPDDVAGSGRFVKRWSWRCASRRCGR